MDLDDLIGVIPGGDEGPPEKNKDLPMMHIGNPEFTSREVAWGDGAYTGLHHLRPRENHALAWRCFKVSYRVFPAKENLKNRIHGSWDAVIEFTDSFGGSHRFWMWKRKRSSVSYSSRFGEICDLFGWQRYPKQRNYIEVTTDFTLIRQAVRYCEGTAFQLEYYGFTTAEVADWKPFPYDADCTDYDDLYWGDPPF